MPVPGGSNCQGLNFREECSPCCLGMKPDVANFKDWTDLLLSLKDIFPLSGICYCIPFCSYLLFQDMGGLRCFPDSFHLWTLSNCKGASKFSVLPLALCRLLTWLRMWWIWWNLCLKNPSFDSLFTQSPGTQHKPKRRLIFNSNELAQKERVLCHLPSLQITILVLMKDSTPNIIEGRIIFPVCLLFF